MADRLSRSAQEVVEVSDTSEQLAVLLSAVVDRRPLPYEHRSPPGELPACVLGEDDPLTPVRTRYCSKRCPGCRAAAISLALLHPDALVQTNSGLRNIVDAIRALLVDEPALVHFERELARRAAL